MENQTTKTTMSYRPTRSKGIYKTPQGKYRVRKMVDGKKISKNFTKFKEAFQFKKQLVTNG